MRRYIPRPANPCYVWDSLAERVISTHLTFESACNKAYILNHVTMGRGDL